MRVVLDTNILVSACWKPGGLESEVVGLAIAGNITPCVSSEILAEYRDVLSRPKLASGGRAPEVLAAIENTALLVEATQRVKASTDDDDNRFLECAVAAGAQYIVTGNLRHYPAVWPATGQGTQVVNARAFLSRIAHASVDTIPLK
jgi:putative PIN family toxin of toxin-antitoxin system